MGHETGTPKLGHELGLQNWDTNSDNKTRAQKLGHATGTLKQKRKRKHKHKRK